MSSEIWATCGEKFQVAVNWKCYKKIKGTFRVVREGVGIGNVQLYIIGKRLQNITTGSKWMMYSEVGPSVMI